MTDSLKVQGILIAQIIAIKRCYAKQSKKHGVFRAISRDHDNNDDGEGGGGDYLDGRCAPHRQVYSCDEASSAPVSEPSSVGASTVDISSLPQAASESDSNYPDPSQMNAPATTTATRGLKRLKIYYAKRSERQGSARKLTKLKRLSIEADEFGSGSSESSGGGSSIGSDSTRLSIDDYAQLIERQLERQRQLRPRRLLLFVNPYGGKGKALNLFKTRVRRLLELAQIDYKLIVTKYANHARDTIEDAQFSLAQYDGIVCVGGDGMFAELMNGLLFRWNRALLDGEHVSASYSQVRHVDGTPTSGAEASEELRAMRGALGGLGRRFVSPQLPIGVIGAGSTDANLFGFSGTNDVVTATLNIILGRQISIDVCSIHAHESDRLLRFASTFVAYGYFGDVVRESEKLRWLGPSRYDLIALNSLIKCRAYEGLVRVWRSLDDGRPHDSTPRCDVNCLACECGGAAEKRGGDLGARAANEAPAERAAAPTNLELIECQGPFVGVNAAVTACRCPQTRKGFSPGNHLANGCADLILVRPCTRLQYVNYLIRTGYTKKSAFDLKYVDAYRCRQFEFIVTERQLKQQQPQPQQPQQQEASDKQRQSNENLKTEISNHNEYPASASPGAQSSSWNADGEILHEQSIRVKVNRRLLRVFGTGEQRLKPGLTD